MKKLSTILVPVAVATALSIGLSSAAFAAGVKGKWKRKDGSIVKVYSCKGGKLCGKIISGKPKNFEMFHGMSKKGSSWKGAHMKHPSMPGFMTFNGTVKLVGSKLSVKGCAVGQSMCDAEKWSRVK